MKIKCHTDNLYCPYIGVCYSVSNKDCDEVEILPHGISKRENANPYIRTSQKTMDRERALLAEGHPVQYVHDKLLDESGGPFKSKSQSSEHRDKRKKSTAKMPKQNVREMIKANMSMIFPTFFVS